MTDRAALEGLSWKYRTLTVLRETREAAIARGLVRFPTDEAEPRRAVMKALAARHPGALRELDESTAAELRARATALELALAGGPVEPWMEAAALFHLALAEALRMRRGALFVPVFWVVGRVGAGLRGDLARPPSGRLLDVVWTAVARELGTTPREAERLVYPRAPPRGARI
jgi:hypothetical protein